MRAEEYRVQTKELSGQKVSVASYKIGGKFHCHVSNVDPGATIVRTEGKSREEAEQLALKKAMERLANKGK